MKIQVKKSITLRITPKMATDAQGNEKKALVRHLGTHFDVMNKDFPLEYTERKGLVFDVSSVKNRDKVFNKIIELLNEINKVTSMQGVKFEIRTEYRVYGTNNLTVC